MTFNGCFLLFLKIKQIFSGSLFLMGMTIIDETYIFEINI